MSSIDTCLYEIQRLRRERDRVIAQRAAMEGALWHAEWLLKKVVDGTRLDVEEIRAFLTEPRHHPTDVALLDGKVGTAMASEGPVGQGDMGHVDA